MTQNNTRKEPTFGETANNTEKSVDKSVNVAPSLHTTQTEGHTFTPTVKQAEEAAKAEKPTGFTFSSATDKKSESEKAEIEQDKSAAKEPAEFALNKAERVVPNAASSQEDNNPKVEEMKKAVSSLKGKRIGLVALLAVILGGLFFWLKPSTPETVEELQQQQGGNLPIEFRPVDEAEAQKAEAEAKAQAELQAQQAQQQRAQAEAEAQAQIQAQAQRDALAELQAKSQAAQQANQAAQQANQATTQPTDPATQQPQAPVSADGTQAPNAQMAGQPATDPTQPAVNAGVENQAADAAASAESKPAENATAQQEEAKVVRQPARKTEKRPAAQQKVKAMTASEFNARKNQNAQMDKLVQSVSEGKKVAKPTAKVVAQSAPAKSATASADAVSSKTLTVPKGTSLMQVFRDNNLSIADVNAMSKVNKAASSLKTNEKVTVRLDKNNRVVEMSIGSGGKYIRQANGSYSYK